MHVRQHRQHAQEWPDLPSNGRYFITRKRTGSCSCTVLYTCEQNTSEFRQCHIQSIFSWQWQCKERNEVTSLNKSDKQRSLRKLLSMLVQQERTFKRGVHSSKKQKLILSRVLLSWMAHGGNEKKTGRFGGENRSRGQERARPRMLGTGDLKGKHVGHCIILGSLCWFRFIRL